MSAAVAWPRLMSARVWREDIPASPIAKPLWKPARSSSHAAGSFTCPSAAGQFGIQRVEAQLGRDPCEVGDRHDRILEERTGAAAVLLSFDEEHAFAMPYLADGVVDVNGFGRSGRVGEVLSEISIGKVRLSIAMEAERHLGDDVPATLGGVEYAAAIAKAARVAEAGSTKSRVSRSSARTLSMVFATSCP